jgi:FlaA1/EpsC-like NDP-sugar epimerase
MVASLCIKSVVFWLAAINRVQWRYVGMADLLRFFAANAIATVVMGIVLRVLEGPQFPRSVYLIDLLLCFLATTSIRFIVRIYREAKRVAPPAAGSTSVLVYGAGAAGVALVREIYSNPGYKYDVAGFLDDDPRKTGVVLNGVKVLGRGRDAASIVDHYRKRNHRISEIIIAMPSASGRHMQEALANCRAAGVRCKTIPGVAELLGGKVTGAMIRDVAVTDLLGREPVLIEENRIRDSLEGRVVMVSGAAGSIGSELCRQIAGFGVSSLVLFDQAESELFRIEAELRGPFPKLDIVAALGDIRDEARVRDVITGHKVECIYHAAAYKHVPMMEAYPLEAVRNNVLGTWNLARTAYAHGVANFLMISSDKAVNPTSVMGATKRVDELILSGMPTDRTKFVSVRFGNVLGSNGSVIPTFQKQIEAGGPVTVTHEDMRRYFMTIREAVQLVLMASTMGAASDVFVLDMGEPVRIADLARQMIRLAGLVPDEDIRIKYTGVRAGEKLFEELVTSEETVTRTSHPKINILKAPRADSAAVAACITEFEQCLASRDVAAAIRTIKRLVPEYDCGSRMAREGRVQLDEPHNELRALARHAVATS